MTEQEYNGQVRAMAKAAKQRMLFEMSRLNLKQTGVLMKSLKVRTRKKYGLINNVRFSFARQGIFVKLGVGRGYGKKTGRYRTKKDWYSKILDQEETTIANFAAQFKAEESAKVIADAISTVQ